MNSLLYIEIWAASFVLFLFSLLNRKAASILTIPIMTFCFSIAAIRGPQFPDTVEYYRIFDQIWATPITSADFHLIHGEIGFKALTAILLSVSSDPVLTMAFYAFLSFILLAHISSRNNLNIAAVWLVYYSSSFLLKDLAQIRNSVATLIVVSGIFSLDKKSAIFRFIAASIFFQYAAISAYLAKYVRRATHFAPLIFLALFSSFIIDFRMLSTIFGSFGYVGQYSETVYVDSSNYNAIPAIARASALLVASSLLCSDIRHDERFTNMRAALYCSIFFYIAFSSIPILSQRLGGYLLGVDAFMCALLLNSRKRLWAAAWLIFYALTIFSFNISNRAFLQTPYESIFQ